MEGQKSYTCIRCNQRSIYAKIRCLCAGYKWMQSCEVTKHMSKRKSHFPCGYDAQRKLIQMKESSNHHVVFNMCRVLTQQRCAADQELGVLKKQNKRRDTQLKYVEGGVMPLDGQKETLPIIGIQGGRLALGPEISSSIFFPAFWASGFNFSSTFVV